MVDVLNSISALLNAVPDSVYGAIIGLAGTLVGSFVAERRNRKSQFVQMLTSAYGDLLTAYSDWVQSRTISNMIKFETAAHKALLVASKDIYNEILKLQDQIISNSPDSAICNAAISEITFLARADIRRYLQPFAHDSKNKVANRHQKKNRGSDHDNVSNDPG